MDRHSFRKGVSLLVSTMDKSRYCLLVPHYNHFEQFSHFLPKLLSTGIAIIVVDDASKSEQIKKLEALIANNENICLLKREKNGGKGNAVIAGLDKAIKLGYSHALQIDADGQHNFHDIAKFIHTSQQFPDEMICGKPVFDESAPSVRVQGRKLTRWIVVLETLSCDIKDGLCGFRVYPLKAIKRVISHYNLGGAMSFDTEILVKSCWYELPLRFIDTEVVYPENNVSHFRYLQDNVMLVGMHIKLILGMLVRLPLFAWRALS